VTEKLSDSARSSKNLVVTRSDLDDLCVPLIGSLFYDLENDDELLLEYEIFLSNSQSARAGLFGWIWAKVCCE
jgi:hypothetical protein